VLQCVGTAKTDDADIFLAWAEIAIVADADFGCDLFCNFIHELCSCEVSKRLLLCGWVQGASWNRRGVMRFCRAMYIDQTPPRKLCGIGKP
jgi:hypothetical protein